MMKPSKRILATALAVCLAANAVCVIPAYAAEPTVAVDETAYITLDYYGKTIKESVVKGCTMNGSTSFTDYGYYQSVLNMSTLDQPRLEGDSVVWELTGTGSERFFYEAVLKENQIEVPWQFDISYRLNGVPVKAEALAGKSGLVRIDVHIIPDHSVNSYYRDNFILMAGMMADMEDTNSFSAPGAQLLALGNMQAAFFVAMPGEETDFTFEIGSDSFETTGIFMAAMPVTLSQMDDISEVKDHKENLESAGSAIDNILDDLFGIMSAMSGGMSKAADGMDELNQARAQIDQASDRNEAGFDRARSSMNRLRVTMRDYADYLGDTELSNAIEDMGKGFDGVIDSMETMGGSIEEVFQSLARLKGYLEELMQAGQDPALQQELLERLAEEIKRLQGLLDSIGAGDGMEGSLSEMREALASLSYSSMALEEGESETAEVNQEILQQVVAAMMNELNAISSTLSGMIEDGSGLIDGMNTMSSGMAGMSHEMDDMLDGLADVMYDASKMMGGMLVMMDAIDETLEESGDLLNNGLKTTLDGMSAMMRDMVSALKKTDDLKMNKDVIADIIRDEWNRLDEDLGILNIDTGAEKLSFTSIRNREPESLQIILRTTEIEIDEQENTAGQETDNGGGGFWERLRLVYYKLIGKENIA